jgi:hypothetical protein
MLQPGWRRILNDKILIAEQLEEEKKIWNFLTVRVNLLRVSTTARLRMSGQRTIGRRCIIYQISTAAR